MFYLKTLLEWTSLALMILWCVLIPLFVIDVMFLHARVSRKVDSFARRLGVTKSKSPWATLNKLMIILWITMAMRVIAKVM
jgi:hypothetical protein